MDISTVEADMENVKFLPCGDSAVTVEFSREISEEVNRKIRFLATELEREKIDGVTESIPTFRSITIFFNPLIVTKRKLVRYVKRVMRGYTQENAGERRIFKIPVCYDGEYAPDMSDVSEITGLSKEEIIIPVNVADNISIRSHGTRLSQIANGDVFI